MLFRSKEILPLFYTRNEKGVPVGWVRMMKESIRSLSPEYGTHRMVQDYMRMMYAPCIRRVRRIAEDNFTFVRRFAAWKQQIFRVWPQVRIVADRDIHGLAEYASKSGETVGLGVTVQLGSLTPEDVKVEIYYGRILEGTIRDGKSELMHVARQVDASTYEYSGSLAIDDGGEYAYSYRIVPSHEGLFNPMDLPLIRWANL